MLVLGGAGWCPPDTHCFSSPSQNAPALTESACLCSLSPTPPSPGLFSSELHAVQCGRGESHSPQILCNKVPLRTAQMSSLSAVSMPLTAWCRPFHVGCKEVDWVRFIGKGRESIAIQGPTSGLEGKRGGSQWAFLLCWMLLGKGWGPSQSCRRMTAWHMCRAAELQDVDGYVFQESSISPSTSNLERREQLRFCPVSRPAALQLAQPSTVSLGMGSSLARPTCPGCRSQYLSRCVSQRAGVAHRR